MEQGLQLDPPANQPKSGLRRSPNLFPGKRESGKARVSRNPFVFLLAEHLWEMPHLDACSGTAKKRDCLKPGGFPFCPLLLYLPLRRGSVLGARVPSYGKITVMNDKSRILK